MAEDSQSKRSIKLSNRQKAFEEFKAVIFSLAGEGRVLNSKNLRDLEEAVLKLNKVLESAMKRSEEQKAMKVVPSLKLTAKGIRLVGAKPSVRLYAGERLGALIERTMDDKKLSAKDIVGDLPIRESSFDRIVSGLNSRPPDDILESIASALGIDAEELKEVADLDRSNPVESFFF